MPVLVHPCKSFSFPDSSLQLNNLNIPSRALASIPKYSIAKRPSYSSFSTIGLSKRLKISRNLPIWGSKRITFCSRSDVYDVFSSTHLVNKSEGDVVEENEELELLDKPSPMPINNGSVSEVDKDSEKLDNDSEKLDKDEALAPFLKFFTPRDSADGDGVEEKGRGKMGIVKTEAVDGGAIPGRPVVETGTVLFAEVLGRTLSGRPLLSTRRLFRRIAWHRVRQIKQLNEPIEVTITEWNTGGLLTRIEGLRAFLPKAELLSKVNNFTELKENVGCQMHVQITRMDEAKNDLVLSEKEAWEMLHLKEGTLLEGTIKKLFPYGAQVRIGETNRSGLLHISNMTRGRITSVSDILKVNEKIKVLVVKSMFPDKISLSTAELESEPGLFLLNREQVLSEAEMMAKKYRQKLPAVPGNRKSESPQSDALPFDKLSMYANWKWFKFEKEE
ncbi:hypothetical protein GBA52_026034 [Prunus armeniaca]|nr:hypothetical protein GBA52_026034 [Prunus armeniaca]